MPILKSGFKRMRQDKKKHERNLKIKSELKSLSKKFAAAFGAKKIEEAKKFAAELISKLDKSRSKGITRKNTVSRRKSRILSKLAKV
ncbi:MAG: 30S ribosomal protein S20 [Candidatus Omnitrophota bacterium]